MQFRVLTRNIRILPPGVANNFVAIPFINSENKDARLREIADLYIHSGSYDVLCFQELFGEQRRMWLVGEAKRAGYECFFSSRGYHSVCIPFLFANDGLAVFVKPGPHIRHPTLCSTGSFQRAASTDVFAMKGWVAVQFYTGGRKVKLVTTHIQSSDGDSDYSVREDNLKQLAQWMEAERARDPGAVWVLCGDLNVDFRQYHKRSVFRESLGNVLSLSSAEETTFPESGEKLDYVLLDKRGGILCKNKDVVLCKGAALSDHLPITCTLQTETFDK